MKSMKGKYVQESRYLTLQRGHIQEETIYSGFKWNPPNYVLRSALFTDNDIVENGNVSMNMRTVRFCHMRTVMQHNH